MRRFKPFLCSLLMLIMLPWGAYAGGLSDFLTAARDMVHAAEQAKFAPGAQQAAVTQSITVIHKKCRTAHMPGSACGPDIAMSGDTGLWPADRRPDLPALRTAWQATEHDAAPPRDPPRIF